MRRSVTTAASFMPDKLGLPCAEVLGQRTSAVCGRFKLLNFGGLCTAMEHSREVITCGRKFEEIYTVHITRCIHEF